jgi:FtsZ-interacting cell division protein ZipA
MSLLSLLPVIHCKEGRAGSLQRWVFLLFAHLINTCWWVLTTRSFSVEARLGRTSVWSLSREKNKEKKEESATRISPRELKQNCKTTTLSSKFFPTVPPNQNAKKTRSGKKKMAKTKKELTPQNHVHQTPPTQTKHTQNPKKERGKKNRQRTKTHTANFLIVFL